MSNDPYHISVCVCTYKRPLFLQRLLDELREQETNGLFTYSIVVADNDHLQSAKAVVEGFEAASNIPIIYCVEPRQNIALARNKTIENAEGDFVALIDDDEFGAENKRIMGEWLTHWVPYSVAAARQLQPVWSQPKQKILRFEDAYDRAKQRFESILQKLGLELPKEVEL